MITTCPGGASTGVGVGGTGVSVAGLGVGVDVGGFGVTVGAGGTGVGVGGVAVSTMDTEGVATFSLGAGAMTAIPVKHTHANSEIKAAATMILTKVLCLLNQSILLSLYR